MPLKAGRLLESVAMANADALESLETRVAFQDESIKELSDELFRQQKQIETLEEACRLMAQQLRAIAEGDGEAAGADETPPHY